MNVSLASWKLRQEYRFVIKLRALFFDLSGVGLRLTDLVLCVAKQLGATQFIVSEYAGSL